MPDMKEVVLCKQISGRRDDFTASLDFSTPRRHIRESIEFIFLVSYSLLTRIT